MDLNQTTTISRRRKTFTVPAPPVVPLVDEDKSLISTKSILGDCEKMFKCSDPAESLLKDQEVNGLIQSLVYCRNSRYPVFATNGDLNSSGPVEDMEDAALDMELERLRLEERILRDDVNRELSAIKLLEERTRAEEETNRGKIKELQRKILRNKNTRKAMITKNEELKESIRNVTSMTKDLVDRLNYPKAIIRTFLKVSSENKCQDEDFCREFSDGKCFATLTSKVDV